MTLHNRQPNADMKNDSKIRQERIERFITDTRAGDRKLQRNKENELGHERELTICHGAEMR